jgi:hypothetical protein
VVIDLLISTEEETYCHGSCDLLFAHMTTEIPAALDLPHLLATKAHSI